MTILQSNYPPVKTSSKSFYETFYRLLANSIQLDIAVGYITTDSVIELQEIMQKNPQLKRLNLIIGMQFLEKFTRVQYSAVCRLNDYLLHHERGEVRVVTPFLYHGKVYLGSDNEGPLESIIGSNNLGSIIQTTTRVYETSYLIKSRVEAREVQVFIKRLTERATLNINECNITEFNENNQILEEHDNVSRVNVAQLSECKASLTTTSFEIPIKASENHSQSNLNCFFGKGRKAPNGIIAPRHWYEVELIVPQHVATQEGYPKSKTAEASFSVITDDGWTFPCKISGQNNKNFRSDGDLLTLGKWIKGRLEMSGALKVGERATTDTLLQYGRNTVTFTKTTIPNTWYLDFSV